MKLIEVLESFLTFGMSCMSAKVKVQKNAWKEPANKENNFFLVLSHSGSGKGLLWHVKSLVNLNLNFYKINFKITECSIPFRPGFSEIMVRYRPNVTYNLFVLELYTRYFHVTWENFILPLTWLLNHIPRDEDVACETRCSNGTFPVGPAAIQPMLVLLITGVGG